MLWVGDPATQLLKVVDGLVLVTFGNLAASAQPGGRAALMTDASLDATTIGMDHDAMLQANPTQDAAFMQTFGRFVPPRPTLATGT